MKHINLTLFLLGIIVSMAFFSCRKTERIVIQNDEQEYRKEILVAPYPNISTGDFSKGNLILMDYEGNTIRSKELSSAALAFQRWIIDGKVRYSYVQLDVNAYKIPNVGYVPGPVIIMDEDFNELQQIRLKPYNGRSSNDVNVLDGHDFIMLGDNHYLAIAYFEKKVNNIPWALKPVIDCRVVAPIIQEVKNGMVTWEWDGTAHPEFYENSVEGNNYNTPGQVNDYMHINSMVIDPRDNNLVCSFRNQDQIVKINRESGAIMWRLGGKNSDFEITDEHRFLRQHHATVTADGNLLLFDNGLRSTRPQSRVVELTLDENTKTITRYHTLDIPNVFGEFMGSVQKLGNTYFIGCGSEPRIMEIDATTGAVIFQKELPSNSYRANKY